MLDKQERLGALLAPSESPFRRADRDAGAWQHQIAPLEMILVVTNYLRPPSTTFTLHPGKVPPKLGARR